MIAGFITDTLVVGALIFIFALIDVRWKQLPSIVLTGLLLIVAIFHPYNLYFGILAGIFALLLYEFGDDFHAPFGLADVKLVIIIGLMISSLYNFMIFLAVFAIFQFVYIGLMRKTLYKKGEIPFIPCIYAIFLVLSMTGVIA